MDWVKNTTESFITKFLYERIFPTTPTYKDIALYFRMKVLDWITDDHLGIKHHF